MKEKILKREASDYLKLSKIAEKKNSPISSYYHEFALFVLNNSEPKNTENASYEIYLIGYVAGCLRLDASNVISSLTEEFKLLNNFFKNISSKDFIRIIKVGYEDGVKSSDFAKSIKSMFSIYISKNGLIETDSIPYISDYYSDFVIAKKVLKEISGTVCSVDGGKSFYVYSEKEHRWIFKKNKSFLLREILEHLKSTEWEQTKNISLTVDIERMRNSICSTAKANSVLNALVAFLPESSDMNFDSDPFAFYANGKTLVFKKDMETGKFFIEKKDSKKEDFNTVTSAISYNEEANLSHEIFQKVIDSIPSYDYDWIHRQYGSGILGISNQSLLCCTSPGSNGKTLLNDCVKYVLGNMAVNLSKYIFEDNSSGERARELIKGARLGFIDEWGSFSPEIMKQFVGNNSANIRRLFESEETIKLGITFISTSNTLPKIKEINQAMDRRLYRSIFPYTYVANPDPANPFERKIDTNLYHKFIESKEAQEAMLLWLVNGALLYLNDTSWQKKNISQEMKKATSEWLHKDSIETLIREYVDFTDDEKDVIYLEDVYRVLYDSGDIDYTERIFLKKLKSEKNDVLEARIRLSPKIVSKKSFVTFYYDTNIPIENGAFLRKNHLIKAAFKSKYKK